MLLPTFVDDHFLKSAFAGGSLHNPLVKCVGSHQSVHHHWLCLSDPVTPVLSLQVRLRVLQGERDNRTRYQDNSKTTNFSLDQNLTV